MGLAAASIAAGHETTLILGPVSLQAPRGARVINVETTQQMHEAVQREFPQHDLLIMAAAVADYRPRTVAREKLGRDQSMVLELEPTQDIIAAAAAGRKPGQVVVGFSLEAEEDVARAKAKLQRKKLDMIVFNPLATMNSHEIRAVLLYADGREERLPAMAKAEFAKLLLERAAGLGAQA